MSRFLWGPYFAAGVGVAFGFYFFDAVVMTFFFEGNSFRDNIVSPTSDDIWMRSSTAMILIVLGALVQERINLQHKKGDSFRRGLGDSEARLHESLRESEERFQQVFRKGPLGIGIVGLDYNFIAVNESFCTMLEYSEEELVGRSFKDITHPADIEESIRIRTEVFASKTDLYRYSKRYITKSGKVIWANLTSSVVRNSEGEALYNIGMVEDITERKRAEEELRNSEAKYRTIVDTTNEGFWRIDEDMRIIEVNDAICQMLGYEREEILGRMPYEFAGDADVSEYKGLIERTLRGRVGPRQWEGRLKRKDGVCVDVHNSGTDFIGQDGQPRGRFAFITDITEMKRAEEALRDSEARYRTFVETTHEGFWRVDEDMRIVECNDAACRMTGYPREELLGMKPFSLVDDSQNPDLSVQIEAEARQQVNARDWEGRLVRKDGSLLDVHISATNFKGQEGKLSGRFAFMTDVTERKAAEAALRASEARFAEILEIAPEAVITVGSDLNIQLFNEGAERIFGYEAEEIIGQSLDVLMPEGFRDGHRRMVEEFDRSRSTYRLMDRRQEIVGLRKDGTEFPAAASVSKLETGGEKIFTVMLLDITERKMTLDALIEAKHESEVANQAKSEFLASMSHDLRTPLNAILGFADMINHQYFGPVGEKYREYAVDIRTSGTHLLSLLSEILDLSEIEAGKKSLIEEEFDLLEVFAECDLLVSQKAKSAGIELNTQTMGGQLFLCSDRSAVMQILLNLLSNSIKFTPKGGKVTLSAVTTGGKTVITVADTGRGIEPGDLAKITDPFAQGQGNPYLTKDGWGLGLAIVKSLVGVLGGEFDIRSRVGQGTTASVTLPAERVDQDVGISNTAS